MKYQQKKLEVKSKRFKKKYLFWAYLALFITTQVFLTIQTATSGAKLASLESKVRKLSEEERVLEDKLVEKSSLTALEEKAKDLGFAKNDNALYITPEDSFAKAN